jgi:hypothetical protein
LSLQKVEAETERHERVLDLGSASAAAPALNLIRTRNTMSPKGPYRLVTVNTAPERAKRLIGRVAEDLKEQYTIQHLANCESRCIPALTSNPELQVLPDLGNG